jgi:precorrin-3B synthase
MPTGDGLLVRLAPTGAMPLDAFVALCAATRCHGNGTMEVTARGSLQVRGLTPASAPLFAADLAGLAIAFSEGVPVLAGPLPDPTDAVIDAARLAAELRRAIAETGLALAPKVSVAVDDGSSLHLDGLAADIRLRAAGTASAPRLHVALGPVLPSAEGTSEAHAELARSPSPACGGGLGRGLSDSPPAAEAVWSARQVDVAPDREVGARRERPLPTPPPQAGEGGVSHASLCRVGGPGDIGWLGVIAPEWAVDVVLGLLREIATLGSMARGGDLLCTIGAGALRSRFRIEPAVAPSPRRQAEMVGLHHLRDGSAALGIALAFGHAEAGALAELARVAATHGAGSIRPAPDRSLMLIGLELVRAAALAAAAERLGFVARAGDPRRRVAACPGAPACASGLIAARALAAAIAPRLAGLGEGIAVHVSGCAKGCAHPRPAALTVVGDEQGCGLVHHGTARARPQRHVAPADLAAEVARIFEAQGEAVHG